MGKLNKIEESMKLNLGLLTEKKNEGDIVEGYFAIAVALYLAYGEVDPNKFEAYRLAMKHVENIKKLSVSDGIKYTRDND